MERSSHSKKDPVFHCYMRTRGYCPVNGMVKYIWVYDGTMVHGLCVSKPASDGACETVVRSITVPLLWNKRGSSDVEYSSTTTQGFSQGFSRVRMKAL